MNIRWTKLAVAVLLSTTFATQHARADNIEYSKSEKSAATVSIMRLLPKNVPLTLQVKYLDSSWQFVTLNDATAKMARDGATSKVSSEYAAIDRALGVAPNVYLTQWQTATSGGQSFLIAYRVESVLSEDEQNVFSAPTEPPTNFATRPEFLAYLKQNADARTLNFTLLNLQTIGVVSNVKPYNVEARDRTLSLYIAMSGFEETPKNDFQSMTNLTLLGWGMMQYAQEYDEVYPPMKSMDLLKKAILPYFKDDKLFAQPLHRKPYATNTTLSGQSLAKVNNPAIFVTLYEAEEGSDGKRAVLFADGHVKRVTKDEWTKIKKESGIK